MEVQTKQMIAVVGLDYGDRPIGLGGPINFTVTPPGLATVTATGEPYAAMPEAVTAWVVTGDTVGDGVIHVAADADPSDKTKMLTVDYPFTVGPRLAKSLSVALVGDPVPVA